MPYSSLINTKLIASSVTVNCTKNSSPSTDRVNKEDVCQYSLSSQKALRVSLVYSMVCILSLLGPFVFDVLLILSHCILKRKGINFSFKFDRNQLRPSTFPLRD